MATKFKPSYKPPPREFTLRQMQEQFRAVQQAREEKLKQDEHELVEKIRERIRQLNEMHIVVSEITLEMPVKEVAFTTCRICEFPVIWGSRPPTNCGFCCANMKFY